MTENKRPNRYLTVIVILFIAFVASALFYKIRSRTRPVTVPANTASMMTPEELWQTNLLFKSEEEINAVSHKEQMRAAREFHRAAAEFHDDVNILDYKAQYQRMMEINRKESEATIAKYQAMSEFIK